MQPLHTSMQVLHAIFFPSHIHANFAEKKQTHSAARISRKDKKTITIMTKAQIEQKKSLARTLYLSGSDISQIAEQIEVSRASVSKWSQEGGWKEARAAKNITRPELVNKLLLAIDNLIDTVNKTGDPEAIGSLADKLSKLSATIEKLDKKANVVDAIEVFMAFNRWIQDQASYDPEITPELIKAINKYQNKFLMEKMSSPSSL